MNYRKYIYIYIYVYLFIICIETNHKRAMCTKTHSLYFDFVLKNKERSIILHLKNVQSFTGKFIDMIETIFFL